MASALLARVATALVLAPAVLAVVLVAQPGVFALLVGLFIVIGAGEWARLLGFVGVWRIAFAALVAALCLAGWAWVFASPSALGEALLWWVLGTAALFWCLQLTIFLPVALPMMAWTRSRLAGSLVGVLVLLGGWFACAWLRGQPRGSYLVLLLLGMVWAADIAAYFGGRRFGKRLLAPRISPGKTLAGGVFGISASALVALAAGGLLLEIHPLWLVLGGLVIGLVSIAGDLTESLLKRQADYKDSGNLLPGHGGVLDRIDSLLAVAPCFAAAVMWLYGSPT